MIHEVMIADCVKTPFLSPLASLAPLNNVLIFTPVYIYETRLMREISRKPQRYVGL